MVDKLITAAVSLKNKIASMHDRFVEKYIPTFTRTGGMITCFPLHDDNLKITTSVNEFGDTTDSKTYTSATLMICGKNLYNPSAYNLVVGSINATNGNFTSASSTFGCTNAFIPVFHLRGLTLVLNHPPIEASTSTGTGLMFYTDAVESAQISGSGTNGYTAVVPDTAAYMRFTVPKAYITDNAADCEIQIEIGSVVTPYEPYSGDSVTKNFDAGISSGEIEWDVDEDFLRPGVNNIYSDVGDTTVSGHIDPLKTLQVANDFLHLD